jgi:(p)ppGpp synthase/HD superfamily hydrolase
MSSIIYHGARLAFACFDGHRRRANGKPTITHCCELAGLIMTRPWARDCHVASGYVHDNPEDDKTGLYGFEPIRDHCGEETRMLVWWLTKPSTRPENQHLSRTAKLEMDLAHLRLAPADAQSMKALDRFLNVSDMVRDRVSSQKAAEYAAETEALLEVLTKAEPWCLEQVREVLSELKKLAAPPIS